MGKTDQTAKTQEGQKVGSKATVTVEYNEAGHIQMGLDCPGEIKDGQPSVVAELAMVGCEAIAEAIRERFSVKHEQIGRARRPDEQTH